MDCENVCNGFKPESNQIADTQFCNFLQNGDEDAYEETTAMVREWQAELTDTQYWYFGGQYALQEDISYFEEGYKAEMAPAEEELESTLSALSAYLSTSSEEADDGYAALTADWSNGWHDYDVNLFEYDGVGEFTLLSTRDYDYETDTIF